MSWMFNINIFEIMFSMIYTFYCVLSLSLLLSINDKDIDDLFKIEFYKDIYNRIKLK